MAGAAGIRGGLRTPWGGVLPWADCLSGGPAYTDREIVAGATGPLAFDRTPGDSLGTCGRSQLRGTMGLVGVGDTGVFPARRGSLGVGWAGGETPRAGRTLTPYLFGPGCPPDCPPCLGPIAWQGGCDTPGSALSCAPLGTVSGRSSARLAGRD